MATKLTLTVTMLQDARDVLRLRGKIFASSVWLIVTSVGVLFAVAVDSNASAVERLCARSMTSALSNVNIVKKMSVTGAQKMLAGVAIIMLLELHGVQSAGTYNVVKH